MLSNAIGRKNKLLTAAVGQDVFLPLLAAALGADVAGLERVIVKANGEAQALVVDGMCGQEIDGDEEAVGGLGQGKIEGEGCGQ